MLKQFGFLQRSAERSRVYLLSLISCLLFLSCDQRQQPFDVLHIVENFVVTENSVPIFPKKAALTTDTARRFSLELPRRCRVDWDNQRVLSVLPEEHIIMTRIDGGDPLPKFEVSDFRFERKTIGEALHNLLAGTNIRIIEQQIIPDRISGEIKGGSLAEAVELLTKMVRAYYHFDADANELFITNHSRWLIRMPKNDMFVMALIDAMLGSEMSNMIVNWQDKTMALDLNYQSERNVRRVLNDISSRNYLIAYDMDVYRVYPRTQNPIVWMNILPAFGDKNVKMSIPGVLGRALVTTPEINTKTLQAFLAQQSNLVLISQGTFVLPNGWSSRFDIGQCTREERLETDLIIGVRSNFGDYAGMKKIDSRIALRTSQGEIVNFSIPTDLGDNIVIIGIPTHTFVDTPETTISPFAELVIFLSPRIISIQETAPQRSPAPLSGGALRDFLTH